MTSGANRQCLVPSAANATPASRWQRTAFEVAELFAQATEMDVLRRYSVGERVLEATASQGKRAVNAIASHLGCSPKVLYQHTLVCKCFDLEVIRLWLRRRNVLGQPPSWTHLLVFCRVRSKARRQELFEEWLKRPMGSRELAARARDFASPGAFVPSSEGESPLRDPSLIPRISRCGDTE